MYTIIIEPSAEKFITKLDKQEQIRLLRKIDGLKVKPYLGKMLTGQLAGIRSLRIGDYRVLYSVKEDKLIIFVLNAGNRKNIYD